MIPYYCGRCLALDEKGASAHRCASNQKASASNAPAPAVAVPEPDTKQRWDRKSYNEYQRKLMKGRRAEAKAKRAKPA